TEGGARGTGGGVPADPQYFDEPEQVIVSARLAGDGSLGRLIEVLRTQGFEVATVYSHSTQQRIFEYEVLVTGIGAGSTSTLLAALDDHGDVRLTGAYRLEG